MNGQRIPFPVPKLQGELWRPSGQARLRQRRYKAALVPTEARFLAGDMGTSITSGLAVAIPAAVEAYKLQVESYKIQQEISLKRVEMDHAYVNSFINQASTPDMDQRIRVTQYLAYISSDQSQIGWASLRRALEERRKELRNDIMEHEAGIIRLRGKAALTIDDQTQLAQHLQQLEWDEAEIGKIGSVLKR